MHKHTYKCGSTNVTDVHEHIQMRTQTPEPCTSMYDHSKLQTRKQKKYAIVVSKIYTIVTENTGSGAEPNMKLQRYRHKHGHTHMQIQMRVQIHAK